MKAILLTLGLIVAVEIGRSAEPVHWRELWNHETSDAWNRKSVTELQKLVAASDPIATVVLADKIWSSDPEEGRRLRKRASGMGVPGAMLAVARHEKVSPEEKERLIVQAAETGYPPAKLELGERLLHHGVHPDYDRALKLIRDAMDAGSTDAMLRLAQLYASGIGESRTPDEKPMELFRRAARLGDEYAADEVERRLRLGIGCEIDLAASAALYFQLRNHRDQNYLAFNRQLELADDPNRSTLEHLDELFVKGVKGGDPAALVELAHLFETGAHGK